MYFKNIPVDGFVNLLVEEKRRGKYELTLINKRTESVVQVSVSIENLDNISTVIDELNMIATDISVANDGDF